MKIPRENYKPKYNLVTLKAKALEYIYNANGTRTTQGLCEHLGITKEELEEYESYNFAWAWYITSIKAAIYTYNKLYLKKRP